MPNSNSPDFRLEDRLGLSISEAASALGVSEGTLRSILHEIPHLHVGRRVLIPVEGLKEWLATQAKTERGRVDDAVEEILSEIRE